MQIWVPTNPKGAKRLPLDLPIKPKYLITLTVGYDQRNNIDAAIKKFSENFTTVLFHYDSRVDEWDQFEWSKRAIHLS
ncbi:hypothetical protein K1719_003919 [Acacia pycnantha]|nr:hypothetical protein K1719_003919 [Acacia pycnantha]